MLQRTKPRMSVNKLGEYSAINDAARRHRLVLEQKEPKDHTVPYYTPAQKVITDFLANREENKQILFDEAERLRDLQASSTWYVRRNESCAEALEAFSCTVDKLFIERYEIYQGENDPPKLFINNVAVSVRPEILLSRQNRFGKLTEGAVKLYINKNNPMNDSAGRYTSTLLHQYVGEFPFTSGNCDHKSCYVVDVFGNQVFAAPQNHKRLRRSTEAACKEISRAWDEA